MKILITGASSGIGKATLDLCLDNNWHCTGIARNFKKCLMTHTRFTPLEFDLTQIHQIPKKLSTLLKQDSSFDAVVFAAGCGLFGHLEQLSMPEIENLMQINFLSQVALTKAVLPSMKKNRQGTLIYLGSEAALQGKAQGSIYCASKFALRGFTQALRHECAKSGVRVCLINPGMVKTPFFDQLHFEPASEENYYCRPEEIANAVLTQLLARDGLVIDEINISPLKHKIALKTSDHLKEVAALDA